MVRANAGAAGAQSGHGPPRGASRRAQRPQRRPPPARMVWTISAAQPWHSRPPAAAPPHSGQSDGRRATTRRTAARSGKRKRGSAIMDGMAARARWRGPISQHAFAAPPPGGATFMSQSAPATPPTLPLVPAHVVQQFARRGDLAEAQFLYGEVARRMLGRLQYIRLRPAAMLDAGCGAGHTLPLLWERYPEAAYLGLDACEPLLAHARKRHAAGGVAQWLGKLVGRGGDGPRFVRGDLADTGLAAESLDLVWSNLALHWHPEPHAALAEWRRVLKVGGLAMFSCLGPGTLRELRQAVDDAGLRTATPSFVDMHDFGDLLVENGFADPVMD